MMHRYSLKNHRLASLFLQLLSVFFLIGVFLSVLSPSGLYFGTRDNYSLVLSKSHDLGGENLQFQNYLLRSEKGQTEFLKIEKQKARKISVQTVFASGGKEKTQVFRYSMSQNHAVLNGALLVATAESGNVFESKNGEKFRKNQSKLNRLDFSDKILHPPNVGALLNSLSPLLKNSGKNPVKHISSLGALIQSSSPREIEFFAVLPEDFSQSYSEEELLAEVLRVTFNANQYLKDLDLILIPVGLKVYRGNSRFSSALSSRDPHNMLASGVEEKRELSLKMPELDHDLLVVFSRSYFSRATGLAFLNTACVNPAYSVVFASGGALTPSFEITLAGVLAHEVGHFLGMSHDDLLYPLGFSLMSTRQISMPFGFSSRSKQEQLSFSGGGIQGGSCMTHKDENDEDSDGDGTLNRVEKLVGTDPMDKGSFYDEQTGKYFLGWNTFALQQLVTEINNSLEIDSIFKIVVRDANGHALETIKPTLSPKAELDIVFSEILSKFKNSYGLIEIDAPLKFHSRGSNYSFNNAFEKFNFISQQPAFKGLTARSVLVPYNSIVPNTMRAGSQVSNWLSLVNTGEALNKFRIRSFSPQGLLEEERFVSVPAKGRKDVTGGGTQYGSKSGFHQIDVVSPASNYSFNAFLNRYYVNSDAKIVSVSLVEGQLPSGAMRVFVHNARPRAKLAGSASLDGWVEIVNSLLVANAVKITAETANGEIILDRMIELGPLSSFHVQLPSMSKNYSLKIESLKSEGLVVFGAKYSEELGQSSVESLRFQEELKLEKASSLNTFINTSNDLVVSNTSKKKGTLTCKVFDNQKVLERKIELTSNPFEIISIENLFPQFGKNKYASLSCAAKEENGELIPTSMRIDRFIENRHVIENVLK